MNDFDALLVRVVDQARSLGIPVSRRIDPHVGVNRRAVSRFGCCIRRGDGSFAIELSHRLLEPEWAPWLYRHYSHAFGGVAYMEGAVARGMLGAFVEGEPAGFVGFHAEGTIGMLEVLPPYRRRGVGEALLRGAVRLALERGQYAFGQVFTDNAPSLALQRKVGLAVSEEILYWLF